jgi:hypothetical protein
LLLLFHWERQIVLLRSHLSRNQRSAIIFVQKEIFFLSHQQSRKSFLLLTFVKNSCYWREVRSTLFFASIPKKILTNAKTNCCKNFYWLSKVKSWISKKSQRKNNKFFLVFDFFQFCIFFYLGLFILIFSLKIIKTFNY